jgi:hypothetical protein
MNKWKYFIVSVIILLIAGFVLHSETALARGSKGKMDVCKVVADQNEEFREDLAQSKKITPTQDVSNECLRFANLASTKNAVCRFEGKGDIHVIQVRWVSPGSASQEMNCHYSCLGNPESGCESRCKNKPIQMGTNIKSMACPQGGDQKYLDDSAIPPSY